MKEMSVEEKYRDIKSKLGSKTVSVDYRYLSADHQHRLDIMVDDVLFKSFLYNPNSHFFLLAQAPTTQTG